AWVAVVHAITRHPIDHLRDAHRHIAGVRSGYIQREIIHAVVSILVEPLHKRIASTFAVVTNGAKLVAGVAETIDIHGHLLPGLYTDNATMCEPSGGDETRQPV